MGENVDFKVPRSFWSRLAGRFGTKFYWQEKGQDVSIVNAVAGEMQVQISGCNVCYTGVIVSVDCELAWIRHVPPPISVPCAVCF